MLKKIVVNLLLGLVFCFCFQITAHALPGQVFEDYKESDIYYEDVMYFVDQGVISGKGDNLFYPEDLITIAEVITITEKVIGDENNLPEDWSWWQNPEYKNPNIKTWEHDWNFPGILIKDGYLSFASRNTIACILLNISKEPIVETEPWGLNSKNVFENLIYYNNMLIRGMWEEDLSYVGVSRAEFCHILREFLDNKDFLEPKKEIFVKINQKYEGNRTEIEKIEDYYRIYNFITLLPKNIQQLFVKKGYEFYFVDDAYWDKHLRDIDFAAGVYDHNKYRKRIVIMSQDQRTVFHEFGHFIEEYYYEYFIKVRKIYNTDKKEENHQLMLLTNNTYCYSSAQEYFADGFAMYFIENQKMKENLPELYKIYEELMEEINSLKL